MWETETGTRAELIEELRRLAEGWWHLAKNRNVAACMSAAVDLETGATSVRVGATEYRVTEPTL